MNATPWGAAARQWSQRVDPKPVTTEIGKVDLRVPRDAMPLRPADSVQGPATFRRLTGSVISLYAKVMTTGDIQAHLAEIYDTEISRDTISRITDAVIEDLLASTDRAFLRVSRSRSDHRRRRANRLATASTWASAASVLGKPFRIARYPRDQAAPAPPHPQR